MMTGDRWNMQARTSTNYTDSTDPRHMMSFLETIGAVTHPSDREWERETAISIDRISHSSEEDLVGLCQDR